MSWLVKALQSVSRQSSSSQAQQVSSLNGRPNMSWVDRVLFGIRGPESRVLVNFGDPEDERCTYPEWALPQDWHVVSDGEFGGKSWAKISQSEYEMDERSGKHRKKYALAFTGEKVSESTGVAGLKYGHCIMMAPSIDQQLQFISSRDFDFLIIRARETVLHPWGTKINLRLRFEGDYRERTFLEFPIRIVGRYFTNYKIPLIAISRYNLHKEEYMDMDVLTGIGLNVMQDAHFGIEIESVGLESLGTLNKIVHYDHPKSLSAFKYLQNNTWLRKQRTITDSTKQISDTHKQLS